MATLVTDRDLVDRLKAERKASGADRYDEVWAGIDHKSPPAGNPHQQIVARLTGILYATIDLPGLGLVHPGANVSDRAEDWTRNYRVPDVAVYLAGTAARDCGTHWLGGPDFAVEVASPGDETRDKLPFYGKVGVRELLLIDRDPWALELHRRRDDALIVAGTSRVASGGVLASGVLPLSFRLVVGEGDGSGRPRIEVTHADGVQRWLV